MNNKYLWLFGFLFLLTACQATAANPVREKETPNCPTYFPTGGDDVQIYVALIRNYLNLRGEYAPPRIYLVSYTKDWHLDQDVQEIGCRFLSPALQEAISTALADQPTEIIWVHGRDNVPLWTSSDVVKGGGIIMNLGNIYPVEDGSVLVYRSEYRDNLAAGGANFILELVNGEWTVTGISGSGWIS